MQTRATIEANARAAASWYPIPGNRDRVIARILGDIKMILETEDQSLTPHLIMDGFWEAWITAWFLMHVGPSTRLLNVGANCGYYALAAARAGAHVVAVEPQWQLADNLRMSAQLNGWGATLRVEECAAGAKDAEMALLCHGYLTGSAFVAASDTDEAIPEGFSRSRVLVRQASSLMPDANAVFMDAEGFEPEVWEGLRDLRDRRALAWVALEWSPSRYDAPVAFLRSLAEYGRIGTISFDGRWVEARNPEKELLGEQHWDTVVVDAR